MTKIETADGKAKKLVEAFIDYVHPNNQDNCAKQCALIVVAEVIKEMKDSDPTDWSIPFWKAVKKEIEKL